LFSVPELQNPSDFLKQSQQAMTTCNALRDSFQQPPVVHTANQARAVLFRLDEISRVVCNVIDAAELCRNVHVDATWRQAADEAFTVLSDYIGQLNGDMRLYEATKQVSEQSSIMGALSEEERIFACSLRDEFERDGVHLPEKDRQEILEWQNRIVALESTFSRNLVDWQRNFGASQEDVTAVLPTHVLQSFGIHPVSGQDQLVELSSEPQILQTLIKYSMSPSLRKQVFTEYATAVPENRLVLDDLRQSRHELARKLGYASHGERFLKDKMAQSPSQVEAFLDKVASDSQPAFTADMQRLSMAKQQLEGNGTLEAWDVSHYIGLIKGQSGFDSSQLSQYLTLSQTIEAIQVLCSRLFGITVQEVETTADERWDAGITGSSDEQIRRFDFWDNDGRPLGIMYLDLHPRPGKYGHAAHFTVRCGCVINGEETDASPEFQLPIIALVCNLSSGRGLLTHGEVETVFHELGHALHSLLSRTQFQHLSGTRAPMDFVETPSQLFENFVWDADFLKILAVDTVTGATIPDSLIQALQRSRFEFSAVERRTQLIYAKFDQRLFSGPGKGATQDIFAGLHNEYGMPFSPDTHWYSRFGHLVTYASGYYGYLYSQDFAREIWRRRLEGDPLAEDQGREIWNKMLIHGGARDPNAILTDLNA
jgi:intermediate peptidase